MIIDLTEKEWEFILRMCVRAKAFARMQLLKNIEYIDGEKDLQSIEHLLDKLQKAKNDH